MLQLSQLDSTSTLICIETVPSSGLDTCDKTRVPALDRLVSASKRYSSFRCFKPSIDAGDSKVELPSAFVIDAAVRSSYLTSWKLNCTSARVRRYDFAHLPVVTKTFTHSRNTGTVQRILELLEYVCCCWAIALRRVQIASWHLHSTSRSRRMCPMFDSFRSIASGVKGEVPRGLGHRRGQLWVSYSSWIQWKWWTPLHQIKREILRFRLWPLRFANFSRPWWNYIRPKDSAGFHWRLDIWIPHIKKVYSMEITCSNSQVFTSCTRPRYLEFVNYSNVNEDTKVWKTK